MIFNWLNGSLSTLDFIFIIVSLVLALTLHEFSHGFVAYLLGDDTAKLSGRISFNPLHHIDVFGFLAIMLVGFGWAKPVMMNPYKFKNARDGIALTAVAGPLSNFLLAIIGAFILNFSLPNLLSVFIQNFIVINLILATFNILPIPPLDGFKVFGRILPDNIYEKAEDLERRYGFILILILLITRVLYYIWYPVFTLFYSLVNQISNLF